MAARMVRWDKAQAEKNPRLKHIRQRSGSLGGRRQKRPQAARMVSQAKTQMQKILTRRTRGGESNRKEREVYGFEDG
jgi:hypothetical protein